MLFRHVRFWKSAPPEPVVHLVEDAFLATPQVVELYDFSWCGLEVVCQDASVRVFTLPDVLDKRASKCSMIGKIPPNGVILSDLICI